MELRKIVKAGSSVGLTIPKRYAEPAGLTPGDYVEVLYGPNDTIVVRKHWGIQRPGVAVRGGRDGRRKSARA